ncbi:hypothetical protein E2C01_080000 [Portunus trituberculatus]|uniref:Uncharacterized protein n=1 Tax=Portunus trituberculatus TaxID=210409 RepID=A0A5B7IU99_PORTR|nr:hypothetical protein [Portunus trituberculatus]
MNTTGLRSTLALPHPLIPVCTEAEGAEEGHRDEQRQGQRWAADIPSSLWTNLCVEDVPKGDSELVVEGASVTPAVVSNLQGNTPL